LPGSALKVPAWGGWGGGGGSFPLLSQAPTPVEVKLGYDKKSNLFQICQRNFKRIPILVEIINNN
jgi:hypothetical protein